VIVDCAADHGGNCESSRPGETAVARGVTIIAPLQLAGSIPAHASQLYARTIAAFLLHISRDGALHVDPNDEIVRETLAAQNGEVVQPKVREALGLGPLQSAAAAPHAANGGEA
jgi:NAD(P) transhydrogenase subunit alpha